MGVLGAVACCNGDTWASELGSVIAKGDPFLITTFQKVPKVRKGFTIVIHHQLYLFRAQMVV